MSLQKAIFEKLTEGGFEVIGAPDGEKGLEMIFEQKPDLVLLDLLMPRMDGMSVLKKIRSDSWGKNLPVIILTNVEPSVQMINEIVNNRPLYYFVKSDIELDKLVDHIRKTLKM